MLHIELYSRLNCGHFVDLEKWDYMWHRFQKQKILLSQEKKKNFTENNGLLRIKDYFCPAFQVKKVAIIVKSWIKYYRSYKIYIPNVLSDNENDFRNKIGIFHCFIYGDIYIGYVKY